jgi:hypothetical protein
MVSQMGPAIGVVDHVSWLGDGTRGHNDYYILYMFANSTQNERILARTQSSQAGFRLRPYCRESHAGVKLNILASGVVSKQRSFEMNDMRTRNRTRN